MISRTSVMTYKGVRKPLAQIAGELDVDAVVEGSVLRSGERVRITAQLIRVPADKHVWAQSYEGDIRDTLALQNKVARALAEQIRVTLNRHEQAALEHAKAVNPEAFQAYLAGRYFWNKRTGDGLKKAIDYFNQAIEKDPNYAQAYAGRTRGLSYYESPERAGAALAARCSSCSRRPPRKPKLPPRQTARWLAPRRLMD